MQKIEIMEIQNQDAQKLLNKLIAEQKHSQFLQTGEWQEFQQSLGKGVERYGIREGDEWLGSVLVIQQKLPFGSYFYCPRGPIIDEQADRRAVLESFLRFMQKKAQETGAIFFRFEPAWTKQDKLNFDILEACRQFCSQVQAVQSVQAQDTLVLDLTKTEEELLAAMHPKTRYNIRVAERHGAQTRSSHSGDHNFEKDFAVFWHLMQETAKRDCFKLYPRTYYQKMLTTLAPRDEVSHFYTKLFCSEHQGEVLVANLIGFFGDTVTYLHGASSSLHRNVMAPYLLHWETIREAKKMGYHYYDLWGIRPNQEPEQMSFRRMSESHSFVGGQGGPDLRRDDSKSRGNDNWAGFTRFKKGFGGEELNYLGAWDLIYQPKWYKIYQLGRKLRRILPL